MLLDDTRKKIIQAGNPKRLTVAALRKMSDEDVAAHLAEIGGGEPAEEKPKRRKKAEAAPEPAEEGGDE